MTSKIVEVLHENSRLLSKIERLIAERDISQTAERQLSAMVQTLDGKVAELEAERDAALSLLRDWRWKGYSIERDAETDSFLAAIDAAREAT